MAETQVQRQEARPERGFDDEYVRQRVRDPGMLVRDVGLALADLLDADRRRVDHGYGPPLDSEGVREEMAGHFLDDLRRAGYVVTFTGRRGGHL